MDPFGDGSLSAPYILKGMIDFDQTCKDVQWHMGLIDLVLMTLTLLFKITGELTVLNNYFPVELLQVREEASDFETATPL